MIDAKKSVGIALGDWSAGYVKDYLWGRSSNGYIIYMPVLTLGKPGLIDTRRKVNSKGAGAVGGNRGSLAGIGVYIARECMLFRMDIGATSSGHIVRGGELDAFDLNPFSFHVYKWGGRKR